MENGERKGSFWKGVLAGALVMALVCLSVVGVSAGLVLAGRATMDSQAQLRQKKGNQAAGQGGDASEDDRLDLDRVSDKMEYIQSLVDQYFLYDEDAQAIEDGIYTGLMYGLRDPYAGYYNEEDFKAFQEDNSGEYCGIGAMVQQKIDTGIITVTKVFKGAPAQEAGLLPGDILYKVKGEPATGKDLDLLVREDIRGEEGTYVDVTVLRGDPSEEVDLRIERRQVEVPTVEYQMLEGGTGYIYVMQFEQVTANQFAAAIDDLQKQGMERLVIDLRDNPGGNLDTAVEMMAYVLPEDKMGGLLIYTEDKDGKGDRYYCKDGQIRMDNDYGYRGTGYPKPDGHEVDVPMAVLINGNSASASELFTGALQDYGVAIVVGTQSFGKGIVQNLIPLGDGTAIKLTTSRYYIPSGICIHGEGIKPDVEVELDEDLKGKAEVELSEDNQLSAAIEALRKANPSR